MRCKRAVLSVLLASVLLAACFLPSASAAGDVTFLAVNDDLLPLSDYYMPVYSGGVMYLPYDVFTSYGLGLYLSRSSSGSVICLYNGDQALYFNLDEGYAFDKQQTNYDVPALDYGDSWYVPVSLVCSCFGIIQSYIDASPAPIIRLKYTGTIFTDRLFVTAKAYQMQTAYNDYMGIVETEEPPAPEDPPAEPEDPVPVVSPEPVEPTVIPAPMPSPSPEPEETKKPVTYENTTVFMSFLGLEGITENASSLPGGAVNACCFITEEDILKNADAVRMLCGIGCNIGIHLLDGSMEEYENVSELLFEAARVKTVLVYADEECCDTAALTCERTGCVLWNADRLFTDEGDLNAFSVSRPTSDGERENLVFSLGEHYDLLPGFLTYLREQKYSIGAIRENTTPTLLID